MTEQAGALMQTIADANLPHVPRLVVVRPETEKELRAKMKKVLGTGGGRDGQKGGEMGRRGTRCGKAGCLTVPYSPLPSPAPLTNSRKGCFRRSPAPKSW